MKEFMFIYQGGDPEWMKNTSPEDMAAVMKSNEKKRLLRAVSYIPNPLQEIITILAV